MWHEVVAGAPGFRVTEIYPEQEQGMQRHPSELGHKYMADVAVAMMQQVGGVVLGSVREEGGCCWFISSTG